jgi:colanic acid/amylovoran biosynthesis protein
VKVVVHDASGDDLALARRIRDEISSSGVTLVQEEDPVALKRVIARSWMLVGSRYHSLVAAFSAQVPALALGWSHKYEMLFRDFGCERYVVSPQTPMETVLQYVRELADPGVNASCRERITPRLREMYDLNRRMWQLATEALTGSGHGGTDASPV